jgi:prophage regulatory protein
MIQTARTFPGEVWLSLRQLRAKLGDRSRASIYRDVAAGRLPRPTKLGQSNLWLESEVDAALTVNARGPLADWPRD